MRRILRRTFVGGLPAFAWLGAKAAAQAASGRSFDVRAFGARGNGRDLDTTAINKAILAAAGAGGGIVFFPAGRYLSFSIRLLSHTTLAFAPGAVLVAADPARHPGRYNAPERNPHDVYQDFGHSHWHNSLIWGEDIEDVAIVGPGRIVGTGLTREGPGSPWSRGAVGDRPLSMNAATKAEVDGFEAQTAAMDGLGNKAIALKNVRHATLRDFCILQGGHIAILASGVDDLTIDNLKIDTNRDGIDLDGVRGARLANVAVNSPSDDAIVLKSSLATGVCRPCENVVVTGCRVMGYDIGTMLDGTYGATQIKAPDQDGVTGRIKLGTESNGGFRNIVITDCIFDRCRGVALESVDGGMLEDVVVSDLVMRHLTSAPIFIRVGDRRRAPPGTGVAGARRIRIGQIEAYDIDPRYAAIVAGLAQSPVEDISLHDIRLTFRGGGTKADADRVVADADPAYPEPSMFGITPSWGVYLRHVRGLRMCGIELATLSADARPPLLACDVRDWRLEASTYAVDGSSPLRLTP